MFLSRCKFVHLFLTAVFLLITPSALYSQISFSNLRRKAQSKANQMEHSVSGTNASASSSSSAGSSTSSGVSSGTPAAAGQASANSNSASPSSGSPDGRLLAAATRGSASDCEAAITAGANVNVSPAYGVYSGSTPLLSAIPLRTNPGESDNLDVVKCLVEHGADVNLTPMKYGKPVVSPIMKASSYGHSDIVAYLANHGAKVNTQLLPPNDKNFVNGMYSSDTPMSYAILHNNSPEAVQALIEHGADVRLKYFNRHFAPGNTTLDIAQLTLNNAATAYKNQPNLHTRQQLDSACSIYNLLKAHGATTGPASPVSGNPACGATPSQHAAAVSAVKARDEQSMSSEVETSKQYCASNETLSNFYECSCFAQKVREYRREHGMEQPLTNVIAFIQYPECVAPAAQISKWGADRAYHVEGGDPKLKAQMPVIAKCAGDKLASSFRAKPISSYGAISGYFTTALNACIQQYAP